MGSAWYTSFRDARYGLFWKPADGSGPEERLTTDVTIPCANSWSPDGQVLAIAEPDPVTKFDIWLPRLAGECKPQLFLRTRYQEWRAA